VGVIRRPERGRNRLGQRVCGGFEANGLMIARPGQRAAQFPPLAVHDEADRARAAAVQAEDTGSIGRNLVHLKEARICFLSLVSADVQRINGWGMSNPFIRCPIC